MTEQDYIKSLTPYFKEGLDSGMTKAAAAEYAFDRARTFLTTALTKLYPITAFPPLQATETLTSISDSVYRTIRETHND